MSDKSLFEAIERRDLSGVLDHMYSYLHPINCACPDCDLRARLSLEQRDEPREPRSWDEQAAYDAGSKTHGEI